jgi:hypothetical protein
MKTMRPIYFSVGILILTGLLWIGCGGGAINRKGPEVVAQEFLTALHFGDFETAKKLASPESRDGLDWFESTSRLGDNPFDQDFTITNTEITGDYARVHYRLEDGKEKVVSLKHEKASGWQVIVSKADLRDSDESTQNQGTLGLKSDEDWEEAKKPEGLGAASSVAWDFLNALRYGDYGTAKDLGTSETRSALDMLASLNQNGDNPYDRNFTIVREEIKGKYGKVYFQQEGRDEESFLKVRNDFSNGWLVIMSKSELQESVGERNGFGQLEEDLEKSAKDLEKELNEMENDLEEEK